MAGGCAWSRKTGARARTLRGLVRDTQRALQDVEDVLSIDPSVCSVVSEIGVQASRATALVVLGTSPRARARLLHALIGRQLLPDDLPRGCRWIRVQYGSATQVRLSLGNSEFELVEELQCNKRPWEVLPVEDLLRKESTDLSTILEVEINNQFLKDGLRILIPPDIAADPGSSSFLQLKSIHSELYTKRSAILNTFNPVYLFAIDTIGKTIFSDNISGNMSASRSVEDFWSGFNLYEVSRSRAAEEAGGEGVAGGRVGGRGEPAVFDNENCMDLHQVKEISPHAQFLFLLLSGAGRVEAVLPSLLDPSHLGPHGRRESSESPELACDSGILTEEKTAFMNELLDQWELMTGSAQKHYVRSQYGVLVSPPAPVPPSHRGGGGGRGGRTLDSRTALVNATVKFAVESAHTLLLECFTRLAEVHVKLLQQFILASFDLARELQVVPRKIQYVAVQERLLYETITDKFAEGEKKQELVVIMQDILQEMRAEVVNMDWSVDDLPWHQDQRFTVSNSTYFNSAFNTVYLPPRRPFPGHLSPSLTTSAALGASETDASDGEEASDAWCLDQYDIIASSEESYSDYFSKSKRDETPSPLTDIPIENEETHTYSLSDATSGVTWSRSDVTGCTNSTGVSVKHATTDVQRTVLARLSRKISLKLVKFMDCLKETYFGTLQRCLESLESSCRQELGGRPATEAMRQLLSVGRQVELQPYAAFSLLRSLLDSLRRVLHKLRVSGWRAAEEGAACCVLSAAWRRRVAQHAAHSLSAHRLAKIISTQILERVSIAHEKYQSALAALEAALAGRLHHTQDVKRAIRKKYAPTFARLCLESTSMCDLLMYGTPDLGREIGRGQYGVVYAGRGAWGGHSPIAVKSVLPADERHYHELAMEFFYTRSIPAHPRIVRLFGSIVQKGGAGGAAGRGVLLVSERAVRDLHAAVRAGLALTARMRVAVDIIQGIRYLHSLGLVHRDIKLKNVVLDAQDRAALSDLGFCSYGALMSGSVVGTPIHMAPELFTGEYSAAVDVYAFGVLFWYLCAGDVRLPRAFEGFANKEQLWTNVKKGLRPERLPHFSDECWAVMEESWRPEAERRALPGDLQPRLADILRAARDPTSVPAPASGLAPAHGASDLSGCTEYWP